MLIDVLRAAQSSFHNWEIRQLLLRHKFGSTATASWSFAREFPSRLPRLSSTHTRIPFGRNIYYYCIVADSHPYSQTICLAPLVDSMSFAPRSRSSPQLIAAALVLAFHLHNFCGTRVRFSPCLHDRPHTYAACLCMSFGTEYSVSRIKAMMLVYVYSVCGSVFSALVGLNVSTISPISYKRVIPYLNTGARL